MASCAVRHGDSKPGENHEGSPLTAPQLPWTMRGPHSEHPDYPDSTRPSKLFRMVCAQKKEKTQYFKNSLNPETASVHPQCHRAATLVNSIKIKFVPEFHKSGMIHSTLFNV